MVYMLYTGRHYQAKDKQHTDYCSKLILSEEASGSAVAGDEPIGVAVVEAVSNFCPWRHNP